MNNTTETFVHSRSVRDILSSASAGCHLCSIISTSQKIDPNNLDREDPQQGVIQAYLRSDSYKRDSDKGWFYYVYLSIEDVSWLRIPEEAAENYELLDGILHEQLPLPRHRWTRPIDDLKILPIKGL